MHIEQDAHRAEWDCQPKTTPRAEANGREGEEQPSPQRYSCRGEKEEDGVLLGWGGCPEAQTLPELQRCKAGVQAEGWRVSAPTAG